MTTDPTVPELQAAIELLKARVETLTTHVETLTVAAKNQVKLKMELHAKDQKRIRQLEEEVNVWKAEQHQEIERSKLYAEAGDKVYRLLALQKDVEIE